MRIRSRWEKGEFRVVVYTCACVCARVRMSVHTHVFEVEMRRYGDLGE